MLSENIKNLTFAGRNISVTHAALSSSRVMATCSILGQALGTAIAKAVKEDKTVDNINVSELQQELMNDDCFIPWHKRNIPRLSEDAECSSDTVRNGIERGEENLWLGKKGDCVEYRLAQPTDIQKNSFDI